MRPFEDVKVEWDGKVYTVPSNRVMGAIARVEEFLTLKELHDMYARETLKLAKLAMAFAALVQYAGASATPDDVYRTFCERGHDNVVTAVQSILTLMMPPTDLVTGDQTAGK